MAKSLQHIESSDSIPIYPEPIIGSSRTFELMIFRDRMGFQNYFSPVAEKRLEIEHRLSRKYKGHVPWVLAGYCQCCERDTLFLVDWRYSDGSVPNYRERLICSYCGLNNRQRFVGMYLKKVLQNRKGVKKLFCYEQVTNFYRHTLQQLGNADIVGSEYLGLSAKPGQIVDGVRHEDALTLSFKNGLFDIIISNDVYEHVPDIKKSLSEASRCLREGGILVYTVPFLVGEATTRQRAMLKEDGQIIHLLPEQYHGNPLSSKGSLVFYDFGWDILEFCKGAGFKDAYIIAYYSMYYGYIGNGIQLIFCAEK